MQTDIKYLDLSEFTLAQKFDILSFAKILKSQKDEVYVFTEDELKKIEEAENDFKNGRILKMEDIFIGQMFSK
jgi:hypothetical protein